MRENTTPSLAVAQHMRALIAAFCVLCAAACGTARAAGSSASLDLASQYFEKPAWVGAATYNYLFWALYDAQLVAPGGVFRHDAPLMLTLTYRRDIKSSAIVDATAGELGRLGAPEKAIAGWRSLLSAIVPDVGAGDSIAGIRTDDGRTLFYVNGALAGRIDDPIFGRFFFDIWVGPQSRDRQFTARLTGAAD